MIFFEKTEPQVERYAEMSEKDRQTERYLVKMGREKKQEIEKVNIFCKL